MNEYRTVLCVYTFKYVNDVSSNVKYCFIFNSNSYNHMIMYNLCIHLCIQKYVCTILLMGIMGCGVSMKFGISMPRRKSWDFCQDCVARMLSTNLLT